MAYNQNNPNGSTTMANSSPVVIASDQTQIPVQLNAIQTTTTGTLTTATSTVVATDLMGVGAVTVSMYGTYAGITINPEVYDGVNWIPIVATQLNVANPTPSTSIAPGSNATNAWNVSPLLGVSQFRIRASTYTSGTANIRIEPSAQFTQPNVVVSNPTAGNLLATVSGTVTVASTTITSEVPGVGATNLGKAEDAAHASGDTGVLSLAIRNDNAATALTSANGDYSGIAVDAAGVILTREAPANTANKTNVTAATASTTVLAANAARKSALLVNESTSDCYVSYGGTASVTSYSFMLAAGNQATVSGSEFAGALVAIWNTATGTMRITETLV